jgi:hypothetical protein
MKDPPVLTVFGCHSVFVNGPQEAGGSKLRLSTQTTREYPDLPKESRLPDTETELPERRNSLHNR